MPGARWNFASGTLVRLGMRTASRLGPLIVILISLGACNSGSDVAMDSLSVGTCVPSQADLVPTSRQWVRVWTSQTLTVRRGMYVGLEVIEPIAYSMTPGFPWAKPVVSTSRILAPARPCESAPPATLALAVYYFQAVKTGSTIVSWLDRSHGCDPATHCAPLSDLRVAIRVTDH